MILIEEKVKKREWGPDENSCVMCLTRHYIDARKKQNREFNLLENKKSKKEIRQSTRIKRNRHHPGITAGLTDKILPGMDSKLKRHERPRSLEDKKRDGRLIRKGAKRRRREEEARRINNTKHVLRSTSLVVNQLYATSSSEISCTEGSSSESEDKEGQIIERE